jgi:hypothetical protein
MKHLVFILILTFSFLGCQKAQVNKLQPLSPSLVLWNPLGYGTISNHVMCGISNVHAVKDTLNSCFTISFDFDESKWPLTNDKSRHLEVTFNMLFGLLDENGNELTQFTSQERVVTKNVQDYLYGQTSDENKHVFGKLFVVSQGNNTLTYPVNKRDIAYAKILCFGLFYKNMPGIDKVLSETEFINETASYRREMGW